MKRKDYKAREARVWTLYLRVHRDKVRWQAKSSSRTGDGVEETRAASCSLDKMGGRQGCHPLLVRVKALASLQMSGH